tara:strand:+ start:1988 stop:2908 length:921 start_codon:yes stop_codon:yes gene_type:complete
MAYEMTWFERACELAYNRDFEELFKHVEKWEGVIRHAPHLKKGLTHVDGLPVSSVGDTLIDALLKLCVRMNCTEQCQAVYKVIKEIIGLMRRRAASFASSDAAVFRTRMTLLCAGAFDGDVDLIEFVWCQFCQYSDDQKRNLYLRMLDSAAESGNDSDAKSVFEWLCASRRTHFRGISLADESYDQRLLNVFTRVLSAECTDSADFLLTHSVHLGFNPFLMQSSHVQALVCDLMLVGATKSLDFLCSRSATHPTEFDKEIDKEFIVKKVKEYAFSYEKTHFDFAYRDKINIWLQEKEEPSRKRKST